jgi:hypothetical protein
MVAVHDPEMIRDENCCRAEGSDVLSDHDPALRLCGHQHALVIDATETWPVRR